MALLARKAERHPQRQVSCAFSMSALRKSGQFGLFWIFFFLVHWLRFSLANALSHALNAGLLIFSFFFFLNDIEIVQ